jgi:polyhydroxyalkanoate synthase subunit PhaC
MHAEYLRRLYLNNDLAEGRYRVGGELVDLSRTHVPMFVVATERDHVSPWHSVYRIHHLVSAPVDFVLVSGGHNVGIVSPPSGPGASPEAGWRHARSDARKAPVDEDEWMARTSMRKGSWWPQWHAWLHAHSTGRVNARAVHPLVRGREAIAAPGTYVFQQ